MADLRRAWEELDRVGVDSVWVWDHFFPLGGDRSGAHFECWSLLAAMAVTTSRSRFGAIVTANSYRNPDLLADMARTVDHLSGGRLILGIGAGWAERDYREYGYEFGTAGSRLRDLEQGLRRIRARLAKLKPPPMGPLPILIGGSGERVTLRLVAEHADMWNGFGPLDQWKRKNAVLDEWCRKVGRDPATVQRTVQIAQSELDDVPAYVDAGARHIILGLSHPFRLDPVERLLKLRQRLEGERRNAGS